ncbi:DUF2169 family type VI secretion system accessory protein [Saccharospirillum salsuginis]|uniref:DUF2169 domain-containing protein n=1 Tax=Saccharospirillum salsuginis TaxID=418750 RepID=A0A918JZA1_9GAMM|nr:DUF2169 domain-containing protein [Saccharospirillum salsuginis]GGX38632.1 hypothetical protein GCM10007392_01040 [Saccharospirillum salsuginis]
MELDNTTTWQAQVFQSWAHAGQRQQVLVIKAGYRYERDGTLTPLETTEDLVAVDEYRDDPACSSVSKAAELVPFKQGFELVVQGRVEPQPGKCLQRLGVSLVRDSKAQWEKQLALFGPRVWKSHPLSGLRPSDPGPLEPLDICWENAFGGISESGEARFDNNPAGCGWAERQGRKAKGQPIPQIDQEPLITRANKRYQPAGYGPIAPHWGERTNAFDTLDKDKSQEGGCPYTSSTPENLYNCAPVDQQLSHPPQPGDRLVLSHWYPDHPEVEIELPSPSLRCVLTTGGRPVKAVHPHWDTLMVNTTDQTVHLIFRLGLNDADLPDSPRLVLSEEQASALAGERPEPEALKQEGMA